MNGNRAWFEALEHFVWFYPKLTATMAFGVMAGAGRMIPARPANADGPTITQAPERDTPLLLKPERRNAARKTAKPLSRKTPKRIKGRRKAS